METIKINAIDLFSGIGGISLALQPYIETIMYCEIDSYCHRVLYERMKDGQLESAPIHADVNTLRLSKHMRMSVQAIIGGYPCQDISTIGNMKGITEDSRSGLFYQIMRIVDENPGINLLFLENVANIISIGMKEVCEELVKRSFQFKWLTKSASSLGAPHVRNRWFCLAYRGDIPDLLKDFKKQESEDNTSKWSVINEPEERITFKQDTGIGIEDLSYDSNWIHRCHTLGNTVVPCVVKCAFEELAASAKYWIQVENIFGEAGEKLSMVEYPYPESAVVVNGKMYNLTKAKNYSSLKYIHNFNTNIIDSTGKLCKMLHLPTPRHGLTHPSSLTERSMHDLPTVLVNCEKSREYMESKGIDVNEKGKSLHQIVIPNVNYIEWMMGYPKDWTKISVSKIKNSQYQTKQKVIKEHEVVENPNLDINPIKIKEKQTQKYNGMHAFMREQSGKDVRQVASMWRVLSDEEKLKYKQMAKTMVKEK